MILPILHAKTSITKSDHSNKFPVPEVVYDLSLIFSPYVLLFGLLFDDEAFVAPSLTSPERFSTLEIEPGRNQLPLPLKTEKDDVPVFRSAVRTRYGWSVSPSKGLTYAVV
jgi:hypothetical protein